MKSRSCAAYSTGYNYDGVHNDQNTVPKGKPNPSYKQGKILQSLLQCHEGLQVYGHDKDITDYKAWLIPIQLFNFWKML